MRAVTNRDRPVARPAIRRQGYAQLRQSRGSRENRLDPQCSGRLQSSSGVRERTPEYPRVGVGGPCSLLRTVWRIAGSAVETEPNGTAFSMGNRCRRERRIGAVTAFEWALSATRRRDEVSSAVTAASAATAARARPRLRRPPRRPMTAKPVVATRAMIAMTTATTVTSAGAVHHVVHNDRRSSRSAHAKRGAKADDAIADRRIGGARAWREARARMGVAAARCAHAKTGRAAVPLRG